MSPARTLATARRVLQQLLHDRRTLGLLFVVPCLLLAVLSWMYSSLPHMFDMVGPALLGIFPFTIMFLVTSVTTLRERTSGTLERLLVTPMGKPDIIFGYALVFGGLATIQTTLATVLAVHVLGLDIAGPEWLLVLIAVLNAVLGAALGLLASAFASTEFQAVQFMPALILPQFLLCGLLVPLDRLPNALHAIADVLPLTHAVSAMRGVSKQANFSGEIGRDILIIVGFIVVALVLGSVTLRRKTK